MIRKPLLTLLAVGMLLVSMVPTIAMAGDEETDNGRTSHKEDFRDLNEASWAMRHIDKLSSKNIINGYQDNTFHPNKPVTRAEAVVMAIKSTNAASVNSQVYNLPFNDAKKIPTWAADYISQAVVKGLLPADVGNNFQANKPATRLWTATLLVRVQNLTDQVYGQQNSILPFTDVAKLSSQERAYVAVAMANNLIQGYPDNTFRPNKGVTRAEMATMLGKADEEIPLSQTRENELVGTVVSITPAKTTSQQVYSTVYNTVDITTPATITLKSEAGKETTYTIAANAKVFIGDRIVQLSDLANDTRVELVLGKDGTVVYIEATPESYVGTLVVADNVYQNLTLRVRGENLVFTMETTPVVTINNITSSVTDLKAGMHVRVQLTAGKVSSITAVVFKHEDEQKDEMNGDNNNQGDVKGHDKNKEKHKDDQQKHKKDQQNQEND